MPRRRLKNMQDVRRYITNLVNRIESDEIDHQKVQKIANLLTILPKFIEGSTMEERIETLEAKLNDILRQNNVIMHNSDVPGEIDVNDYDTGNHKTAQ